MDDFVKGMFLETKQNQWGGEYIKASINVEKIFENPIKNEKYINFMIFKSKGGTWYTQLTRSPQGNNTGQSQNIVSFAPIDEDELPF